MGGGALHYGHHAASTNTHALNTCDHNGKVESS